MHQYLQSQGLRRSVGTPLIEGMSLYIGGRIKVRFPGPLLEPDTCAIYPANAEVGLRWRLLMGVLGAGIGP